MNQVAIRKNEIVLSAAAKKLLLRVKKYEIKQQELENDKKELTDAIKELMEVTGTTNIETEFCTITYTKASDSMRADPDKMRRDGIFEKYSKPSHRNSSIKIEWK